MLPQLLQRGEHLHAIAAEAQLISPSRNQDSIMALLTHFILGFIGLFAVRYLLFARRKSRLPLPPGPPPKPIIGNLLDLPPADSQSWHHWLKHKELYGPISSVTVFGQTLVILNSHQAAVDLMEKRSALYSSRPHLPIAEITGWKASLRHLPKSDRFRAFRKTIHQDMGTATALSKYHDVLDAESHRFLFQLLHTTSDKLADNIRRLSGAVILKIVYGYTIEPHGDDPLVDHAEETMIDFSRLVLPGAWMVNFVPFLSHLPEWFPGDGFKQLANAYNKRGMAMNDVPFEFVQQQMARKDYTRSFVSDLLETKSDEEIVVKWTAAALYAGGADTTVSAITTFFMAMALSPDVQRKAQDEIDRVVGTSRLPSLEDRNNLPYLDSLVKEVLRWHPVTPLGVTHAAVEDDVYNGYLIPKDANLVPNVWAFTHDPSVYHEPMEFNPERFLDIDGKTPEPDPGSIAFGYGRRVCPGRLLAEATIYLAVARSLAVFTVSKAVKNGKEVPVPLQFTSLAISHPAPFDCRIEVRSPGHEQLIEAVEKEHPWTKSHAAEINQNV
ncbi:hypothetical protein N8T08_010514 [Aspergillus melleus]|uniref:Uncharacterized protein n=1 Tax=Aspergillus melleus TaxID=138277 RepID=A0ACC3ARD9_9EURO|nr:hypothetical protein N8T08_010514 [Aspergillus melleus]